MTNNETSNEPVLRLHWGVPRGELSPCIPRVYSFFLLSSPGSFRRERDLSFVASDGMIRWEEYYLRGDRSLMGSVARWMAAS